MKLERLGDILKNLDNKRIPLNSEERIAKSKQGLYPYIGANNIVGYIDEYIFDEKILCVAEDGGSWGAKQQCAVIYEGKTWVNNHAHVLVENGKANLEYIKNFLNYTNLNKYIKGATRGKLNKSVLENILIPLPPLPDQLHIANLLSKAEDLIAQRKETIRLLNEFLKSTFLEMFGDPVKNEKGWDTIQLQKISKIQGGLQVTTKREINPIELPYLRVANVYRNFLDLSIIKTIKVTKEEAERARLEKDDILIVEGHGNPNEIGRSSIWNGSIPHCLHQNHLIRVRVNYNFTVPIYVNYFINSPSGRKQMFKAGKTTSGLNTISSKIVKETVINLPSIEFQTQFAQIVEKTEALKTQYQQSLQELENLYGSLSQKAFRGELTINKAVSV